MGVILLVWVIFLIETFKEIIGLDLNFFRKKIINFESKKNTIKQTKKAANRSVGDKLQDSSNITKGLGVTLLLTLALVGTNFQREIAKSIPDIAPDYFFEIGRASCRERV